MLQIQSESDPQQPWCHCCVSKHSDVSPTPAVCMTLSSQRRRGSLVSLRLIFSWVLKPTCVVHSAIGFYSVIICETNSNINSDYFGYFWHFLEHSLYGGSPRFVLPFSFNNLSIPKAALSIYAEQFLFNICNSCILKIYLLLLLICICI